MFCLRSTDVVSSQHSRAPSRTEHSSAEYQQASVGMQWFSGWMCWTGPHTHTHTARFSAPNRSLSGSDHSSTAAASCHGRFSRGGAAGVSVLALCLYFCARVCQISVCVGVWQQLQSSIWHFPPKAVCFYLPVLKWCCRLLFCGLRCCMACWCHGDLALFLFAFIRNDAFLIQPHHFDFWVTAIVVAGFLKEHVTLVTTHLPSIARATAELRSTVAIATAELMLPQHQYLWV